MATSEDQGATAAAAALASPGRRRGILRILAMLAGIAALSIDMYLPGMQRIATEFAAPEAAVQATLSAFLLGFALGQVSFGPVSDDLGRRPAVLMALGLYAAASLAAASADSLATLTLWRGLQGFGGGAAAVVARAVLRDLYDGPALARQMSYLLAIALIAPLVAPVIGGQIVALSGWRYVFLALFAFGAAAAAAVVIVVPETLAKRHRRKADLGGLARLAAGMFADPAQVRLLICNAAMSAALFAYLGSASELYMGEYGLSPQSFAYAFCSVVAALAVGAFASARAVSQWGPERALRLFALTALAGAGVVVAVAVTGAGGLVGMVGALMTFFLSMNGVNANASALLMQRYAHAAGAASAVLGATQFLAGAAVTLLLSRLDAAPLGMALVILTGAGAVAAAATLGRAR